MIDSAMTEPLAQVSSDVAMEVVEGDEVFHSSSKERLPFAFSHRFKKYMGLSPAAFRLRSKGKSRG